MDGPGVVAAIALLTLWIVAHSSMEKLANWHAREIDDRRRTAKSAVVLLTKGIAYVLPFLLISGTVLALAAHR
ncbi:hypothetical protein [Pseudonocardia thermophila]|uniref:hypothetical protein n=1 Tax=Pseudonocardia thermophila TaxID=1848 RepID=UPI00248EB455|nr:hypothetical protein [Pseudonocardia thermophila]